MTKRKKLAAYLGTTQQVYSRYEKGENEIPVKHIIALCKYYNISADYFRIKKSVGTILELSENRSSGNADPYNIINYFQGYCFFCFSNSSPVEAK